MPILLVLLITLLPSTQSPENAFAPLEYLIGEWKAVENASFGKGEGSRSYRMILGDTYLLSQNTSHFEPQERMPDGDHHEDWTFFSYDSARKALIVRQFNIEGFVNTFAADAASTADKLIFVSESTENSPPGLRARLTYEKISNDQFRETFELASPGKDFSVLVQSTWNRVP